MMSLVEVLKSAVTSSCNHISDAFRLVKTFYNKKMVRATQWKFLFSAQDYNSLEFLFQFLYENKWIKVNDGIYDSTKFGKDHYLSLTPAYTKYGEIKLFQIRERGARKDVRINPDIYHEFQKQAERNHLKEKVQK